MATEGQSPSNDGQHSLQELAKKLPEADALPDGFSECPTEVDPITNKQSLAQATNEPANEEAFPIPPATSEDFPDPYSMSETAPCGVPAELNDVSPCSSPSEKKKDVKEKLRRFPVQLSAPDDEATNESETDVPANKKDGDEPEGHSKIESTELNDDSPVVNGQTQSAEQDSAAEIDQLIKGTALSDNGDKSVEGLHSSLLEDEIQDLRKRNEQLMNENLTTRAQLAKSLMVREKLESLCRELQRHNKQLTDECQRIASEEQQKRLDLSTRFHDAIKDVTAKLEEQGDERMRQIKENELLQQKLKQFAQQFDLQEQQYAQELKTKSLEQQLLEVKLKQHEELQKQGEAKIQLYAEQIAQLLKTEQDLRGRLALYGDKFEQFQETLTKSNEFFASFKSQMEKMSKTIKKLEKENLALQKKCEKSDVSLIELVDERAQLKKQLETTKNQKEKLEALCRTLQAERKQQNMALASVAASAAATGAISVAAALKTEQQVQE